VTATERSTTTGKTLAISSSQADGRSLGDPLADIDCRLAVQYSSTDLDCSIQKMARDSGWYERPQKASRAVDLRCGPARGGASAAGGRPAGRSVGGRLTRRHSIGRGRSAIHVVRL